jgi:hypothetical protein
VLLLLLLKVSLLLLLRRHSLSVRVLQHGGALIQKQI